MLKTIKSNINLHRNANKNNNVEPEASFHGLTLQVPYDNMAIVAEGLKQSFLNEPDPTTLNLVDGSYGIVLSIMWVPRPIDNTPGWCQMNRHAILLYHHGKKIQEWTDKGNEYNPDALNYKQLQDFIDSIVKKDIEEVRNSGEDIDTDYMRAWLGGNLVNHSVFPLHV